MGSWRYIRNDPSALLLGLRSVGLGSTISRVVEVLGGDENWGRFYDHVA